jgi:hypothetical protein
MWTHVWRFNLGSDDDVTELAQERDSLNGISVAWPQGISKREDPVQQSGENTLDGTHPPYHHATYGRWIRYFYEIRLQVPAADTLWSSWKGQGPVANPTANYTGDPSALSGTWNMLTLWKMEEGDTVPTRILYRVPWGMVNENTWITSVDYEINSSATTPPSEPLVMYARNVTTLWWSSNQDGVSEADTAFFKAPVGGTP